MGTSKLGNLLVDEGLLTESDRRTIKRECGTQGSAFAKSIVALGLLDETELAAFLGEHTKHKVAPKDLTGAISQAAMGTIDRPLLERLEVIPLDFRDDTLDVAMADPLDSDAIAQLRFFTGYKIRPVITTFSQIRKHLKQLIPEFVPKPSPLEEFLNNHLEAASARLQIQRPKPGAVAKPKPTKPVPTPAQEEDEVFDISLGADDVDLSGELAAEESHTDQDLTTDTAEAQSQIEEIVSDAIPEDDQTADLSEDLASADTTASEESDDVWSDAESLADVDVDLTTEETPGAEPAVDPIAAADATGEAAPTPGIEDAFTEDPTGAPKTAKSPDEIDALFDANSDAFDLSDEGSPPSEDTQSADAAEPQPEAEAPAKEAAPVSEEAAPEGDLFDTLSQEMAAEGDDPLEDFASSRAAVDDSIQAPEASSSVSSQDDIDALFAAESAGDTSEEPPATDDQADVADTPQDDIDALIANAHAEEEAAPTAEAPEDSEELEAVTEESASQEASPQDDIDAMFAEAHEESASQEEASAEAEPEASEESASPQDDIDAMFADAHAETAPEDESLSVDDAEDVIQESSHDTSPKVAAPTATQAPVDTVKAVATLNRALISLALIHDRPKAAETLTNAFRAAGFAHGAVFDQTGAAIFSWTSEGAPAFEPDEAFSSEGIGAALQRLDPEWNDFTATTRQENLAPFLEWGEPLLAARVEANGITCVTRYGDSEPSERLKSLAFQVLRQVSQRL